MNKVFKVIWSEARNAYVVVSEIAKNHGSKSCSTKKLLTMLIATGVMTCASMAPALAGNPAPDDLNVTIGKGAHVSVWNGSTGQNINGDIAVGPNAHAWNGEYTYENRKFVAPRIGSKEYLMDFGQGAVEAVSDPWYIFNKTNYKVADGSKIAGSIAIGKNTVARTGSVMLGDHSYTGKLGDVEINPANAMTYNDGIYSTTLGAGAYNSGSLAAVTGALSIASSNDTKNAKNTGATIYGSLNSIESATSNSDYSGVASSVLGFANRTQNANAALIWGTGNEVTNSVESIGINTNWNNVSVAEAQQKAIEAMQSSEYAGGSVLAIGGGNKADYAKYSQLTGVQNKVTGTKAKAAKNDFVNGYKNTVKEASDVTVIGTKNEVTADGNKVIGDNHKVSGKNNVIFGSVDKLTETTVNNAVVLGHNAKVTGEGGVALGAGSVANRANAVSVGSKNAERQITNVAAGEADTDAVNVSQLKDVKAEALKHTTLSDGKNTTVVPTVKDGQADYKVNVAGDLTDITSVANGDAKLALNGAAGTAAIINGQGASVFMMNGSTTINGVVGIDNTGKISGVANGEISATSKDAVNGSQLHQTNQNVAQNAADIATNKANIAQNAADIATNKADIATNKANIEKNAADITQNKADIAQNKADIKNLDNRVTDVEEVAKKHTTVTKGDNIVVSEDTNADGGKEYKVALKNDITLAGDAGDFVSISGSKGTIWASGSVAAGNVVMDGATATVSGLSNKTTAYDGFANGKGKAATEEQLKEVATEAGKHTQVKAGTNVGVVPGKTADGTNVYTVNADGTTVSGDSNVVVTAGAKDANNVTNYGVKLNKDLQGIESVRNGGVKLALNGADGTAGLINGKGASIFMMNGSTTINGVVGIDNTGKISGVANGVADKDAVNVSQLKDVKAEAGKHTTLSDGKNTTVESTVKDGQTDYKVNVAGDLTDITSVVNGGAKLALNGAAGYAGIVNGKGASVYLQDGYTKINNQVIIDQDGKISGVAAGTADTDAVNVSQLKKVSDTANAGWTLSTNGNATAGTKVTPGAFVDFSGDQNVSVSNKGTAVSVKLNNALKDIESISNGDAKLALNGAAGTAGIINGKGASVYLQDGYTKINNKVIIDQDGKISGVAAGKISADSTDAVNGSQLNAVATEAGKHSKVVNGTNTNVEESTVDGQKVYKVNLNNNVMVGDVNGKYVSISGTNGTVEATGAIATKDRVYADKGGKLADIDVTGNTISNGDAKLALNGAAGTAGIINGQGASVYMQGSTTVINSKVSVDKDGKISGVAAGTADTDAVNVSQLQKAAAASATTVSDGVNTTVTATKAEDGHTDYKVNLNKDLVGIESISNAGASLTMNGIATELANGQGASVKLFGDTTTINNAVTVYKDGRISGVADGINNNDAVNVGQLNKVSEIANKGWNLATNGVATEATNVKPGETVDFSGDKNISVSHDGTKVKVELNKDIDVNSVQTNALTSKYNLSVGTMAENGIMPFFVNSTGDFYAAHNKFHVDKDGKVTATAGEIGNVVLQNGVYYGHSTLQDGSLLLTDDNGNHSYIDAKGAKLGKVTVAEDGKITGVAAGAVTADSTDAVNGSQLHAVATEASKHSKVVNGSNINVEEFDNDGQKIYKVNLNKDIMLGDLTGKYVNISGTNGTIETTGYIATNDRVYADKGGKLADIDVTGDKISNGASSIVLDGSNVKVNDKVTIDQNGKISGVAAGEVSSTSTDAINGSQLHQTNENVAQNKADIAQNKADIAQNKADIAQNKADIAQNKADIAQNKADIATNKANIEKNANDIATNKQNIDKLNTRVDGVEKLAKQHTTVTAGDNITVTEGLNADGGKEYNVAMNKDINLDSVTTGQTVMNNDGLKVGDKVSVTATAVTAGKTSISDEGVKVGDKTYISDKGLNANDQKVTNVAAGEISATSKDAVNGSQLYATNQEVVNNTNRINKLGSRVNKVGAGAAALAALHPMDFDPDDKLTFSAGYGNYAGENAAAIGAYYRPDEKVMFSVAGTVGNGENMVNAGVSFALDRTNHVSNSRTALAREVIDLRGQLAVMGAKMAKMEKAFGMLDETKTKLFPDVPANHWAYEYIAKLAGNGYIEGYPDGNFGGDRLMTRYEFAAMLYRAIENGAALEEKIIKEFEPELGRIRVDRISGEDGDRDKIERVRVNDTKGERDHYGNKLAK